MVRLVRGAVRLLLTLFLAAGSAAYLGADGRVTLADRGSVWSSVTSAPTPSAALMRMGGTVGANERASNQGAAPDVLQAAGSDGVTLTDTPTAAPMSSPAATVTAGSGVSATVVVLHDGKSD